MMLEYRVFTNSVQVRSHVLPSEITPTYQAWLRWLTAKGVSAHTHKSYAGDVQAFLAFLGTHLGEAVSPTTFTTLSARDIRAFLALRLSQNASHRTTARNISAMKSFLQYLASEHGISCQALANISLPRLPKRLPRPIAADKIFELLANVEDSDWLGARDRAVFMLLYGSGLRISEALSLTIRDVEGANTLTIKGKGRKERAVPLIEASARMISQYRNLCPYSETPERALFIGAQGKPVNPSMIQKAMREIRRLLNLPEEATPHALRHSFASHLLANGANLREVQALLGHSNLATTQQYVDVNVQHLIKVHEEAHPREEKRFRSARKK